MSNKASLLKFTSSWKKNTTAQKWMGSCSRTVQLHACVYDDSPPGFVQAPSRLTTLRWCPMWMRIFSSDIKARYSLDVAPSVNTEKHKNCLKSLLNVRVWKGGRKVRTINWPLSIFTATVVHVVAFSMPKAAASTTWPNAPRPSGSPSKRDTSVHVVLPDCTTFLPYSLVWVRSSPSFSLSRGNSHLLASYVSLSHCSSMGMSSESRIMDR